jgi:fumarate reductase subunit D
MQSTQHRKAHTKLLAYALSFLSGILFTLVVLTLYHAIHPYSYETGFHTDIGTSLSTT